MLVNIFLLLPLGTLVCAHLSSPGRSVLAASHPNSTATASAILRPAQSTGGIKVGLYDYPQALNRGQQEAEESLPDQDEPFAEACGTEEDFDELEEAPRSSVFGANMALLHQDAKDCRPVNAVTVDVYVHYMRKNVDAQVPENLEQRVKANLDRIQPIFGEIGISFNLKSIRSWEPPQREDSWDVVHVDSAQVIGWRNRTYNEASSANPSEILHLYLVNELTGGKHTAYSINGRSSYPERYQKDDNPAMDGIVMRQALLAETGYPRTLIHELGHWFGLRHTFGLQVTDPALDCRHDDGVADTPQMRGLRSQIFDCEQRACDGGVAPTNNWMSYSACTGQKPMEGFTPDQRAFMMASYLRHRRLYQSGECEFPEPRRGPWKTDAPLAAPPASRPHLVMPDEEGGDGSTTLEGVATAGTQRKPPLMSVAGAAGCVLLATALLFTTLG